MKEAKTLSVAICTPTSGQVCKTEFASSVIGMVADLERSDIRTCFYSINGGHISEQRDMLAHMFLNRSSATHILFVDSDMKFHASLCRQLLDRQLPMIGAVYSKRSINFDMISSQEDLPLAYEFIFNPIAPQISVINGLCEVESIGMGFALINRSVFYDIINKSLAIKYYSPDLKEDIFGFFREIDLKDSRRMSEDFSFCARFRASGGHVFSDVDIDIKHVGDFSYGVPFRKFLERTSKANSDS